MKLGSLFDGSGGFPLAGAINGIEPVWASEIEPYPLKVTAVRFPQMTQLGDITKINGAMIEPVDVITFGSPCQDLSVAGKQAGIHEGERSNLFFEAIRIIKEMRAHESRANKPIRPRFAVWENVTGAFRSNGGVDFQAVLQALAEVCDPYVSVPMPAKGTWQKAGCIVGDGYSVAWRVYDAQFWGVPQRRKRIYLVADFGSERAGEILFERESMFRDSAQGREAREGTAENAEGSVGVSFAAGFVGCQGSKARSVAFEEEINPTLRATTTTECVYAVPLIDSVGGHSERGCYKLVSGTLKACHHKSPPGIIRNDELRVRHMTPLEFCRLQGFPDWWEDGVEGSDSARYKMWGNGIALPCAVDVLGRIAKEHRRCEE